MKKLLAILFLLPSLAFADTKISALTSTTTLNSGDIIPVVTNPAGAASNRVISKANLSTTLDILTNVTAGTTYLTQSSATATYLQQSSATVSYCHADGSNCTGGGTNLLLSSGIAFGSASNTVTSDTNTLRYTPATGFFLGVSGAGKQCKIQDAVKPYIVIDENQANSPQGEIDFTTLLTTNTKLYVDGSGFHVAVSTTNMSPPPTNVLSVRSGSSPGVTVDAGTFNVQNISASQFVKTDASKNLISYDLLGSTQAWTGQNNWTTPAQSTFTYGVTVGSLNVIGMVQGAGLSSCSGASNALTWNSGTSLFGCNTISGSTGGSSSLAVALGTSNGNFTTLVSSPTGAEVLNNAQFLATNPAGTTSYIALNPSSVTLQGQNVIDLTSALQSGATFYVSSGTVAGNLSATNFIPINLAGGQSGGSVGLSNNDLALNGNNADIYVNPGNGFRTNLVNGSTLAFVTGNGYIGLVAPPTQATTPNFYTLPSTTGVAGQALTLINSTGTMAWSTIAGGGSGITALTGDVTASGTGSVAATAAANQPNIVTLSHSSTTVTGILGLGSGEIDSGGAPLLKIQPSNFYLYPSTTPNNGFAEFQTSQNLLQSTDTTQSNLLLAGKTAFDNNYFNPNIFFDAYNVHGTTVQINAAYSIGSEGNYNSSNTFTTYRLYAWDQVRNLGIFHIDNLAPGDFIFDAGVSEVSAPTFLANSSMQSPYLFGGFGATSVLNLYSTYTTGTTTDNICLHTGDNTSFACAEQINHDFSAVFSSAVTVQRNLAIVSSTTANVLTISTVSTGINLVSVSSTPASNASDFLLMLSSQNATPVAGFQYNGHIVSSGTVPVLSSCGSSPSIVGTDTAGTVTGGTGATGCTITFASPYANDPVCIIQPQTESLVNAYSYTHSTTAIVFTQTGLGTGKLDYHCWGNKG